MTTEQHDASSLLGDRDGDLIPVLDHGFVRLVDHMGGDISVSRSARVSFDADWRAGMGKGSDERLIRYLMNNDHASPFESVVFTFEIKCPMFIARQWHRHRTWAYNEVSARYTELPDEFYVPKLEMIGGQSQSNKQARVKSELNHEQSHEKYVDACNDAFAKYKYLLSMNWPRELARGVLPMSTYTRFFGTVNLRNLLAFIELRDHGHAQLEAQAYARALKMLISDHVPVALAAFQEKRDDRQSQQSPARAPASVRWRRRLAAALQHFSPWRKVGKSG